MPPHIELDDLIQAGMVGLLEAVRRFTADHGSEFHSHAAVRVRGAMLDYVRQSDWSPRWLYRRCRAIDEATRRLNNEGRKLATSANVAAALGVSLDQYHRTLHQVSRARLARLDDVNFNERQSSHGLATNSSDDPADDLDRENLYRLLASAIDTLPEKERVIILLYYDAELLLREIGDQLDLSESRVCQLLKRAIEQLRAVAQSWVYSAGPVDAAATELGQ